MVTHSKARLMILLAPIYKSIMPPYYTPNFSFNPILFLIARPI